VERTDGRDKRGGSSQGGIGCGVCTTTCVECLVVHCARRYGCGVCKTWGRRWGSGLERSIVGECFRTGECPSWWGGFDFDIALGRKAALENY
jgi:hypothetical protein